LVSSSANNYINKSGGGVIVASWFCHPETDNYNNSKWSCPGCCEEPR
jgi:hypothetical protein